MTHDTAKAINWSFNALYDLASYLLRTNTEFKHEYVRPGFFQQDDLEKHFAQFRRSAGCNYFVTTKEVFATHSIDKAKMMLGVCEQDDLSDVSDSHLCDLCKEPGVTEQEFELLSDLTDHLEGISNDDDMNLFYAAGYIAFKHKNLRGRYNEYEDLDESSAFLTEMDRGKLSYPSEELFLFLRLAFLFFTKSKDKLCRRKLVYIMQELPSFFMLDIFVSEKPLSRIANILFKRFSDNIGQDVYRGCRKTQSATLAKLSSKSSK